MSAAAASGGKLILIYGVVAPLVIAWSWWAGKDVSWDFINYHLYLGRSVWADRWAQDFFPASIQSYLNPYAYVPVAAMVEMGAADVLVGAVLASVHALNVALVWLIAGRLVPQEYPRRTFQGVATALAVLSPVFLQQVGGTFADITTAIPCLLACYLLLAVKGEWQLDRWRLVAAGLFLGIAVALKLTNAPIAAGMLLGISLCIGASWVAKAKSAGTALLGCGVGLAVAHGYWGWKLYQEFGNPFFPFFNSVFRSPDFLDHSLFNFRFVQGSVVDLLSYAFRIALPERMVYTEPAAPDVRVAATLILLCALAMKQMFGRLRPAEGVRDSLPPSEWFFIVSQLAGLAFWLASSANGRYALPLLILLGPLVPLALIRLVPSVRWASYGIGAVLLAQAVSTWLGSDHRWNGHPWSGKWLNVQVPSLLAGHPHLFLSFDLQSHSFLSAYVHPGSGFVNVGGQYVFGPGAPGFARLERLIAAHPRGVRTLIGARVLNARGEPVLALDDYAGRAARYGFEISQEDCVVVTVREKLDKLEDSAASAEPLQISHPSGVINSAKGYLFSCAMQALSDQKLNDYQQLWARMDPVLNHVEDICPKLFRPRRPVTEIEQSLAIRKYVDTGVVLWTDGNTVYAASDRGGASLLGTVNSLSQATALLNGCTPPVKEKLDLELTREQLKQLRGLLK